MLDLWRSGQSKHQFGNAKCTACDYGWPQRHSDVVEHCCPGLVHAETRIDDGATPAVETVLYYCDLCYDDDPL